MRIREFAVANYRAFRDPPPFMFADRFTLIAGVNGRGKTAILDALALTLSRLLPQISPAHPNYRYLSPTDVHYGQHETKFALRANCAGYPLDSFEVEFHDDKNITRHTKLPKSVREEIRKRYGDDPRVSNDAAPIAVYYTTDRADYRRPRSLPKRNRRDQKEAYTGALSNRTVGYRDLMNRLRKDLQLEYEARIEAERQAGAGKTPDEDGWGTEPSEYDPNPAYFGPAVVKTISRVVEEFVGPFSNLRIETRPLRLMVDKGATPLDIGQLSDGERSFLAMTTDLSRRLVLANPKMENPFLGVGVVLIDELELHLHPTWQRNVIEKLKRTFPNLQFVATTHSPFIIQSLKPGELRNLDPKEFGEEYSDQSIEDISEEVMGVDLPQKSERYSQMMKAAEDYFRLLRQSQNLGGDDLEAAKRKLDELSMPFSDDPAYQALLKVERETTLGDKGHAPG